MIKSKPFHFGTVKDKIHNCSHTIPTVVYNFHNLYWAIQAIKTRKQANYALKTESLKNIIVCSNLYSNHTSATPKILKIRKTRAICLLIFCKKYQHFITPLLIWELFSWVQKFLFFSKIKSTITVSHPKGLTWHFIETKAIKHDYYSSLIMWTHKKSR